MAAAIADFVPVKSGSGKWKDSRLLKNLELKPSPNILEALGQSKTPGQILVGFALETESAATRAREKMIAKHCDLMVVNTPLSNAGQGFGTDQVEAAILNAGSKTESEQLALMGKNTLAVHLVRQVAERLRSEK